MPVLLQISIEANVCSIGRIEQQIGDLVISHGWDSYMTYSRGYQPGKSTAIKVGNVADVYHHVLMTRLFDRHGLHSRVATRSLIGTIKNIAPDIIHLHQIHGYYLNIEELFNFLIQYGKPVVWTFHDCWAFTGHCAHFVSAKCNKWQTQCKECPLISDYPKSYFDRSYNNYLLKKDLFTSLSDLHIVTVSKWLESITRQSFFKNFDIRTIYNGVDTKVFKPVACDELKEKYHLGDKKILLAAATAWTERKGLKDYIAISNKLHDDVIIVLVGLEGHVYNNLPSNIIALPRTNSQKELAALYSMADIVMNLSYEETFGLTTAEGMACGTPGVVYNITASPELITKETGVIVEPGDIEGVVSAANRILEKGKVIYSEKCRERAINCFDKDIQFADYYALYKDLLRN